MASKRCKSGKFCIRERITGGANTALKTGRGIFRGALDVCGFVSDKIGFDKLVGDATRKFKEYRERTSENEEV